MSSYVITRVGRKTETINPGNKIYKRVAAAFASGNPLDANRYVVTPSSGIIKQNKRTGKINYNSIPSFNFINYGVVTVIPRGEPRSEDRKSSKYPQK